MKETIDNDVYLNSCSCPDCNKKLSEVQRKELFIVRIVEHIYIKGLLRKRK